MSPALAGRLSTTAPPGKPLHVILKHSLFIYSKVLHYFGSPFLLRSSNLLPKILFFGPEMHLSECPCREVINFCLSEKVFISLSFLKGNFSGHIILGR